MPGVKETSIEAWAGLSSSTLETQRSRILRAFNGEACSRRLLAHRTGLETSAVPGRVLELIEAGLVRVRGKGPCPLTGRTVELLERT